MNFDPTTRRLFLKHGAMGVGGVVLLNMLPEALHAAHRQAKTAAESGAKFAFLSAEEAADIKAFGAQIFPTDDTPGANEANVVHFIDHVLSTSGFETQEQFRHCLAKLNGNSAELFPGTARFSALSTEQQQQVITNFETFISKRRSDLMRMFGDGSNYFDTLRTYVIAGFLSDPDDGGNKDMVGWQLIDFDGMGAHEPPFGFYDAELLKRGEKK